MYHVHQCPIPVVVIIRFVKDIDEKECSIVTHRVEQELDHIDMVAHGRSTTRCIV
jgi:hypothetical protein